MRVFETRISDMVFDHDFGRVEASVSMIVKTRMGQPARRMRLRTSAPIIGTAPLEERLAQDAIRLATAMTSPAP